MADFNEQTPDKSRPFKKLSRWFLKSDEAQSLALASSMGMSLVLATVMGLAFGYWLDKKLGTKPVFLFIFLFLGLVAGFKNLFVILKKIEKKTPPSGLEALKMAEKKKQTGSGQDSRNKDE